MRAVKLKTVELNIKDWAEICYVLGSKGRQLEEMGLGGETKNLERIRTLIKEQLMQ